MSIHISSAVWKAPIANAGLKIVLLALADIANHEGDCWPSKGTLAAMTSLSRRSVQEHLQTLREQGIIEIQSRLGAGGRQTSNFFTIRADKLPTAEQGGERNLLGGEGAKSAPLGERNLLGGGSEKQPPLNHQIEPPVEQEKKMRGKPLAAAANGDQKELLELPDQLPDFPSASMVAAWNRLCPTMRKVQALAGSRMKSARARWKELGSTMPNWEAFCQRIEASDFLTGRVTGKGGGRTFTADFDWCILPASALKIREGKYDNEKPTPKPTTYGW